MKKLLKEPLIHFLVLGFGLFLLFELVSGDTGDYDDQIIRVDRDALLAFAQYRFRTFDPEVAGARLDGLSKTELETLIDDYVREEALYREALALGLDREDYIIKRRLIQSLELFTNAFVTANSEVSDADVAAYYTANRRDYYIEPFVTFTHVFFANERHGRERAQTLATAKLAELNAQQVPFSDSPRHGDRFPYHLNYVEREADIVASHFGASMAREVFSLAPGESWQGPFESPYGAHLVMLTRRVEGRYPALAEVEARVRDDARREALDRQEDAAIQAIVDRYQVRITYQENADGGDPRVTANR